jgi:hypothetical protein
MIRSSICFESIAEIGRATASPIRSPQAYIREKQSRYRASVRHDSSRRHSPSERATGRRF